MVFLSLSLSLVWSSRPEPIHMGERNGGISRTGDLYATRPGHKYALNVLTVSEPRF
jgi:hypothetical protein